MTTPMPPIVSRSEWQKAREDLLVREKELTRLKDSVSAARRRLPMVEITQAYTFDAETGPATLLDLFDGRRQLIVQHFMFGPDWEQGCDGCSMMADHIGPLSHLHAKDTSFVMVSRAPLVKLLMFRERMGWKLPWVSSAPVDVQRGLRRHGRRRRLPPCLTVRLCSACATKIAVKPATKNHTSGHTSLAGRASPLSPVIREVAGHEQQHARSRKPISPTSRRRPRPRATDRRSR